MKPYIIQREEANEIPIVVSVPHCGTAFPRELKDQYDQQLIDRPDDTDWFVNNLYDFAPELGITMISAVYSRWVIDLNRNPADKPLYTDGRIITGLCPTTDFLGKPLYKDKRELLSDDDVTTRLELYYQPYHDALQQLLDEKRNQFGAVLLWDCHSIRQQVPTIYANKFPDMILGNNEGKSADSSLIKTALDSLKGGKYRVENNFLFKGGHITRHYGRPSENQHALQLEMTKINYMDDDEIHYDLQRAGLMRKLLKDTFTNLAEVLNQRV